MVEVKHYTNNRNPHKHIEVHYYIDHHRAFRQYMKWDNGVVNYVGSRKGRLFRIGKKTLVGILEDYTEEV